jgi:glutaconate CoA-transferase subunit B
VGFLDGGGARGRLRARGAGPAVVITDLACYEFEEEEMALTTLHPGVTEEQVRASLGWSPRVASTVTVTEPPSVEELRLLRDELDPKRLYV